MMLANDVIISLHMTWQMIEHSGTTEEQLLIAAKMTGEYYC